ncbi:hypothetical protein FZEAL_8041 [Fusarium zealandicum]|uniref:Peroxin 11C n=1 Tax=Fusarium zealandicum TaxID=1053134 RepID=A0A8H4UF87_9HYPO|nr:hypothetical protein FZEAL_8041 [Fusarium zealandicum]
MTTETVVESPAEAIYLSSAERFVADIPSAEPIVADTPPAVEPINNDKSPSPAISSSPLARLAAKSSGLDAFLVHLHRCVRTRGGTDTVLLFSTYAAQLVGAILGILGRTSLRYSASKLVEQAFKLPPSSTVNLSTVSAPRLAALALSLSQRIQGFTCMLSEWRTMNRMWGVVATYLAARDLVLRLRGQKQDENGEKAPPPDRFNTFIDVVQILLNAGYHCGEAAWWLTSKGATSISTKTGEKIGLLSAQSWSAWVFVELFRLLVERARRIPSGDFTVEEEWKTKWKADFIGILPWAPLSAHWGTDGGFLPDLVVGALASWPSFNMMRALWRQTA